MSTLLIARGLPGSGKTTWAKCILPIRVNRDDLRFATFGAYVLTPAQEDTITVLQHSAVKALLKSGRDVVVDDTNLNARTVKAWQKIARETGSEFDHADFEVTPEEAKERIAKRVRFGGRDVPGAVVDKMYNRYLKNGFPEIKPLDVVDCAPYVADESLPTAWIFDVDGTLTTGPMQRSPYEWAKVGLDLPHKAVVDLFLRLWEKGDDKLIVVSGRDGSCAEASLLWMVKYGIHPDEFHMREAGDMRRDDIVKAEIFDTHIRNRFNVLGVFDDRRQVVEFWRSIGLTCMQVADGDF